MHDGLRVMLQRSSTLDPAARSQLCWLWLPLSATWWKCPQGHRASLDLGLVQAGRAETLDHGASLSLPH